MPYTLQRGEDLLHKKLARITEPGMLWGMDISEEGVGLLREMGFNQVVHGDCEQLDTDLKREGFEIILAGELIEHLANPGRFLESVSAIMNHGTELMITTCNANSFKGFLHAMMRREKVHPEHNYYFSYRTLKQLMDKFDLNCREVYYYQEVHGHGLSRLVDKVASVATRISPVWSDGVIVRAST